ncbi:HrgA protein [Frigidibacter sp. RF13]|uniref:HrgA protein n=1 Tax=Frigidibacter sp. RF13 TaxID=2997340 RepID=UPI002270E649|nr:HrgA protein [Frigidibacter sp. RF13]MCY1127823.1 HrgA protein [Frigidibacter sp. RF13]
MSKTKTLVELAAASLGNREGERLTARKLAETIVEENPDWVESKRKKSRNQSIKDGGISEMILQVQAEIGSIKYSIEKHPNLRMTEDRPRRYYYTSLTEEQEVAAIEDEAISNEPREFKEHDLYPRLSEYLATEHGVYSKRINELRSSNRHGPRGNQWLHPDLIGFEAVGRRWSDAIRQLVNVRSDPETRLWSFEVKRLVNRSNAREVFFQALSNSAWANLGYLVAAEISGSGTLDELRMLSAQHGIGVILLSVSEETETSILVQARLKPAIDWSAADRLCRENTDAAEVFRQVRVYHQSGEINSQFWNSSM